MALGPDRNRTLVPEQTGAANLAYVEALYAEWVSDPGSVPAEWRRQFEALPSGDGFMARPRLGPSFPRWSVFDPPGGVPTLDGRDAQVAALQDRVDQLVRAFRVRGHLAAAVDPLGRPRPPHAELEPSFYGLSEADLDRNVSARTVGGPDRLPLRDLVQRLRNTYCRSIGVQFMHIDELPVKTWLQQRMESTENRLALSREEQLRILRRLSDAVVFEEFVSRKYVGAKSFSLEGSESLIPLLELAFDRAGEQGIDEVVVGMAHRGRLNVLANLMGKSARAIFREFEDTDRLPGRGDVKYHLGHSHDWKSPSGRSVHLSLAFNPSHLEFVSPVCVGRLRAKQDHHGDHERRRGMALLIHGDAAFAGEGVVYETLQLSELAAYDVGGSLHVVVNNQIGFTTPPEQGRSTVYATDVARMLQSPVFHVNGEDPEAVAQVIKLAMEFRREFHRDVVIDMYGYRKRGHNEADEPAFTQPLLYRAIARRKSVLTAYTEHLVALGGVTREAAEALSAERRDVLEQELAAARGKGEIERQIAGAGIWKGFRGGADADVPEVGTGVPHERLVALLERIAAVPAGFRPHRKLERFFESRRRMARGEEPLDWAAAEALAIATLAEEGHRVRLTGQDAERGTFGHRHSAIHDSEDGRIWRPLEEGAGRVEIRNSPLSENAVLGFEYGYSLDCPDGLVAWEAQFGDFVNAAQPFLDQFIASAEEKWQRLSGITLLLPHGYEGMGPEHSSARLERFLELATQDNLQVAQPTTPAQYFHLLRRQVLRPLRKPLVVLTPKSLLRHPEVVSTLDDLAAGRFRRILAEPAPSGTRVRRILACTGKVYWDLLAARRNQKADDVAIVRFEQLTPLPGREIAESLAPFGDAPVAWVQEEPANMGAWPHLRMRFFAGLPGGRGLTVVARTPSASPATGSAAIHRAEQQDLLARAFDSKQEARA